MTTLDITTLGITTLRLKILSKKAISIISRYSLTNRSFVERINNIALTNVALIILAPIILAPLVLSLQIVSFPLSAVAQVNAESIDIPSSDLPPSGRVGADRSNAEPGSISETPLETGHLTAGEHSPLSLILSAGPIVQGVMFILFMMSVISWGIVILKFVEFRKAKKQSERFSEVFWATRNLQQISESSTKLTASPLVTLFTAGHRELTNLLRAAQDSPSSDLTRDIDSVERALLRARAEEITRLEFGTNFLATTASAAPFIGLFGTVWGIMTAFMGLSKLKTSSIQAVAPGISEALIATAIGLAAAIPAAIFFNFFARQVRLMSRTMDMFSAEFLNIARRHFLR